MFWVISILIILILFAAVINIGDELKRTNRKNERLTDDLNKIKSELEKSETELEKYKPIENLQAEIDYLNLQKTHTLKNLEKIQTTLSNYELKLDVKEIEFYRPKFEFEDVLQYAEALDLVREAQKELLEQKLVLINKFNGTPVTGKKEYNLGKLGVNAFNGEATIIIENVSYNNFEKSKEKLTIVYKKVNNLLELYGVKISPKYLHLKIKEMAVAYDYREAEKKSKEQQAELKNQMREEEKARVEAEKARKKAIEEQKRYQMALEEVRKEMGFKSEDEVAKYEKKIQELQSKLNEATEERKRATSMAQITKKGHVYKQGEIIYLSKAKNASTLDSDDYKLAAFMADLFVDLAYSDSNYSDKEANQIYKLIASQFLKKDIEKKHLRLRMDLYKSQKPKMEGLSNKLTKKLNPNDLKIFSDYLIAHVALTDRHFTAEKDKKIRSTLFKLGLRESYVKDLYAKFGVGEISENVELRVQKVNGSRGSKIPTKKRELEINQKKLDQLTAETKKVKADLSEIFTIKEKEEVSPIPAEFEKRETELTLDEAHTRFMSEIILKEEWYKKELQEKAKEFNLMVNAAILKINEWAEEKYGDHLIFEKEKYLVQKGVVIRIIEDYPKK